MEMSIDRMVLEMDRDALVAALEGVCIRCYDHESDEVLREAVRVNIEDGTIDPLALDTNIPF